MVAATLVMLTGCGGDGDRAVIEPPRGFPGGALGDALGHCLCGGHEPGAVR
jgi:hypothetical protein